MPRSGPFWPLTCGVQDAFSLSLSLAPGWGWGQGGVVEAFDGGSRTDG